ncbi:MAG: ABC transporter substrate-binding protein, partial [Methanophagales archaeon]|nr:ABC transporter substrate-binding protein [Methanophagales archaeon]
KELTVIDSYEKIVTVKKPVNRIVVVRRCALETLRTLKVSKDKIVGVEDIIQYSGEGKWGVDYKIFFPEFQDIPTVGVTWTPDIEVILSLKPDVVFLVPSSRVDSAVDTLESAGISALRSLCKWDPSGVGRLDPSELADPSGLKVYSQELRQLGYIFDKKNEAEEFIDWLDGAMNPIFKGSESIPEESKPKVYHEGSFGTWQTYSAYAYIELSGGKNIFEEMSGDIDPEAVIERDPDIIVKVAPAGEVTGYHLDVGDMTEIAKIREEMMSRDILQNVAAVKKGRVYVISGYLTSSGPASASRGFLQVIYQAKWFHPELFGDLDPKAIHQEYLTRFQRLDIDLDKKGVFVYPKPS